MTVAFADPIGADTRFPCPNRSTSVHSNILVNTENRRTNKTDMSDFCKQSRIQWNLGTYTMHWTVQRRSSYQNIFSTDKEKNILEIFLKSRSMNFHCIPFYWQVCDKSVSEFVYTQTLDFFQFHFTLYKISLCNALWFYMYSKQ